MSVRESVNELNHLVHHPSCVHILHHRELDYNRLCRGHLYLNVIPMCDGACQFLDLKLNLRHSIESLHTQYVIPTSLEK
jgi:hypothetical protein